MSTPKLRRVKPGQGTLAALQHICPLCAADQGVRCTTLSGSVRLFVHSRRMDLARDAAIAKVRGPQCQTCNGVGLVGGHRGQTPENYDEFSEPCPDCSKGGAA